MRNICAKQILLVDDEMKYLNTLAEDLQASDGSLHILTAENGERALDLLESAQVDLVVTDLKMPVMDGFEFISRVKKSYPNMPVIVMSIFTSPQVKKNLLALGVSQCIEKFNLKALEDGILRTMGSGYLEGNR